MRAFLRQAFFIALSGALTWLVLLRDPSVELPPAPLRVAIEELLAASPPPEVSAASSEERPVEAPTVEPDVQIGAEAPTPELGRPEGEGELAATGEQGEGEGSAESEREGPPLDEAEAAPPEPAEVAAEDAETGETAPPAADVAALRADPELNERARAELSGEARKGFETVVYASAADQLEIARAFGEELVLVPKAALDTGEAPAPYFRLDLSGTPRVVTVEGPFRRGQPRYRDLFDYDYADLPGPLRDLRRQVMDRAEVYVFGALIPTSEWAVVVGRRDQALERLGLSIDEVRRFVLRFRPGADGRFDLHVERVDLVDGRRRTLSPNDL